jgi:hypothetical protein
MAHLDQISKPVNRGTDARSSALRLQSFDGSASPILERLLTALGLGFFGGRSALSIVGLLLAVGCGDNQDDAGARRLLEQVRADDYRGWSRAPGYEMRRSSTAPHSDDVDIYVNPIVELALSEGLSEDEWPLGSVIVKDGFSGNKLELIAVMERRTDGWYWAEYDDDGDPDYSGKPDICIDCHARGSDFVRAFPLP